MTEQEKQTILQLAKGKIDKKKFFSVFKHEVSAQYLLKSLYDSYEGKDGDALEYILLLSFIFDIIDESFSEILCNILLGDWHYKHEDVVMMLQRLKWPGSEDALYETAARKFRYLDYDLSCALARKCIYALANLNTPRAIEKIQLLTKSDVQPIREVAKELLLNIKNKG